MLTLNDVLMFLIQKGPGRTEVELAIAIFGSAGYQQQVGPDCRRLVAERKVERRRGGGPHDPFRYYPLKP